MPTILSIGWVASSIVWRAVVYGQNAARGDAGAAGSIFAPRSSNNSRKMLRWQRASSAQ
jgi:hypothetical protein